MCGPRGKDLPKLFQTILTLAPLDHAAPKSMSTKQKLRNIVIFFVGCWFCLWCSLGLLLAIASSGGSPDILLGNITKIVTFLSVVITVMRLPKLVKKQDK